MHPNQRFTQVRLAGLLLALVLLLGLWPATPVARADSPTGPAQARHYRADETPPGLIAGEWQQITAQMGQQIYLKASNTGVNDSFGWSVALDGDTLVVGAPDEDSSAIVVNGNQNDDTATDAGAAYVFTRPAVGSTWSQQAYLKAFNAGAGDFFGESVALDGDTLVVGADGEDSNATGVNAPGGQNDNSVTDAGAAYVFTRSGSTWSQQAYLKASNTGGNNFFGESVALDGDTVVVGAKSEDSNATGAGAAYVFTRSGSTWSQQAYLKASNTGMLDNFGNSVALDGNTLVVGANGESSNAIGVNGDQGNDSAPFAGAAYVFTRSGTTWSQQAYLKASNTGGIDFFGWSVDLSGDTVVVGAYREDSNAIVVNGNQNDNSAGDAGAAYIFTRPTGGTTWSQQAYLKASNTGAGDSFGISVALDGNILMVGANGEDSSAGAAYVFTRPAGGTTWSQQAYLKASNPGFNNEFGVSVALSGETLVVGAVFEDSNATGVGGNGDNDLAAGAGAAYTFTGLALSTIYLPLLVKG